MYNTSRWISIPPGTDQEIPLCRNSCGSNRKQVQILCEHVTVNTVCFGQNTHPPKIRPQDRVCHWETGKARMGGMSRDTCRVKKYGCSECLRQSSRT